MIGPRTDRVYYLKTKQYYPDFSYFATNGYGKEAVFNSDSLFLLWIFYLSRSTGLTDVKSAPELHRCCSKQILPVRTSKTFIDQLMTDKKRWDIGDKVLFDYKSINKLPTTTSWNYEPWKWIVFCIVKIIRAILFISNWITQHGYSAKHWLSTWV